MGPRLDVTGSRLGLLLYASQIAALSAAVVVVAVHAEGLGRLLLVALFVSATAATVVALWRRRGDDGTTVLGTAADITYDPIADPGQAAKRRWNRAVRRLPGGDDEGD